MSAILQTLRRSSTDVNLHLRTAILGSDLWLCDFISRGIKVQANELRPGNVINQDGRLLQVVKAVHAVGQGRQLGNVQVELRDLNAKRKLTVRHRPSDSIEKVWLETRPFQFLYAEGDDLFMMDPVTYEQVTVDRSLFGDQAKWLTDGMEVTLSVLTDGEAVLGGIPETLTLEVTEAAAYMKGDTARSTPKTCVLENGVEILAPPYVATGQKVVVNTLDGSFIRRVQ